jgi:hypothetical protein
MTRRLATQATALGLAFVTTLTLMNSIQQLAAPAAVQDTLAGAAQAPARVVVITGKRMAQG